MDVNKKSQFRELICEDCEASVDWLSKENKYKKWLCGSCIEYEQRDA